MGWYEWADMDRLIWVEYIKQCLKYQAQVLNTVLLRVAVSYATFCHITLWLVTNASIYTRRVSVALSWLTNAITQCLDNMLCVT